MSWKTVSMDFEIDVDNDEDLDMIEGWRTALLSLQDFIYATTSMNVTLSVKGHNNPLFDQGDTRVEGTVSPNGDTTI